MDDDISVFLDVTVTGIAYPEKALKKDLWDVVKSLRATPEYVTDKIAKDKGIQFLDKTCD